MSKFSRFMKENKKVKENEMHPVTRSLCDEKGKPLEWEFRHITSKEDNELRDTCTMDVPVTGKPNMFRPKMNTTKYVAKLLCASVASPDLYDAGLQDSYGVKSPEDLLYALVDDPGEFNELVSFVQKFQGFNISLEEKVEEAKN